MVSSGRLVPGMRASRLWVTRVSMVSAARTDRVTPSRATALKVPVSTVVSNAGSSAAAVAQAMPVSWLMEPENSRSAAPGVRVRWRLLNWALRSHPAWVAGTGVRTITPTAPRRKASSDLYQPFE